MREFNRINQIQLLCSEAFRDIPAATWRFDNAAVMAPQLAKAKEYAKKWDSSNREGIGLLLFKMSAPENLTQQAVLQTL